MLSFFLCSVKLYRGLFKKICSLAAEAILKTRKLIFVFDQALVHKGVKDVEAEKAITQVFEGDDADGEGQIMQHGMSKVSMDRLFLQASKQWLQSQSTSPEKRKARIVRWLQYRGFSWGVTNFIWKKLEAQYPPWDVNHDIVSADEYWFSR